MYPLEFLLTFVLQKVSKNKEMKIENEKIEIREELPSLKNFAGGVLFCGATAFFFLVAVTKGNIEDIG